MRQIQSMVYSAFGMKAGDLTLSTEEVKMSKGKFILLSLH